MFKHLHSQSDSGGQSHGGQPVVTAGGVSGEPAERRWPLVLLSTSPDTTFRDLQLFKELQGVFRSGDRQREGAFK